MKESIKKWWRKWLCRHFCHKYVEEVYAQDLRQMWGELDGLRLPTKKPLYDVMRRCYCERCGHDEIEEISKPMRRSELLKQGWFIENGKYIQKGALGW